MKTKIKSVRDMYIAYANKKIGKRYKSISSIRKAMSEINEMTNTEYYFIVEKFFEMAADKIIQGDSLFIPNVGYIFIEKKPVIKGKKNIDWKASHKYKKQLIEEGKQLWDKETQTGEKWWFYLEDDYYLRWNLKRVTNKFISKYIFKPTISNPNTNKYNKDGSKKKPVLGTKGKLSKANQENPNLHLIYVGKLNNIK